MVERNRRRTNVVGGSLEDVIGRRALDLGCVLEDQEAFAGEFLSIKWTPALTSVVLPEPVPPTIKDVPVIERRRPDQGPLARRHGSGAHIVVEREYAGGALPNAKAWARNHGRDQPFEAAPVKGQLAFEDGGSRV